LASESVDVVVAVTTLCFVADAAAAARELGRVLRLGGRLVIGELGYPLSRFQGVRRCEHGHR